MELTKDESRRILRRIELEAYSALVTALRAQGELDRRKKRLLRELGEQLSISTERHRAEIRRAISDDRLSMIAECVCGSDASVEWESEGRRVVPLMPRLVPQTAFTGTATAAANHAANVNATISSSVKGRAVEKNDEEEVKSRKRQRTTSPKPVQKIIVSSIPKTTPQRDTVSTVTSANRGTNAGSKDAMKFVRTSTVPIKQENSSVPLSSVSMKIGSVQASSVRQISSKPIILGGNKQSSSVSVAAAVSKHVTPLPASCLQAHASVVSGNKNKAKINLVKQKPKPKFKPLTAAVKIKAVSPLSHSASVAHSSLSTDKNKVYEAGNSVSKTLQVPRSTGTVSVSPRSSVSLTTIKNASSQKPKSQSPPGIVRNVETTSRAASGQHTKGAAIPRLSRPLPAILPKSIPPKSLSTVATAGRKLASILPAPAKSTPSTISNPVILPVVANSVATSSSSPIPIAPLPRPQSFPGLTSTVLSKVPAVSLTAGSSTSGKRDNRDPISNLYTPETQMSSTSNSETVTPGNRGSSPALFNTSQESVHERETLSPVSEILTLVTSASVPLVSSSPLKSKPLTTGCSLDEYSLKCDEKFCEVKELLKDEGCELKEFTSLHGDCPSSSSQFPQKNDSREQDNPTSLTVAENDGAQSINKCDNTSDLSRINPPVGIENDKCLQKAKEEEDSPTVQNLLQTSETDDSVRDLTQSGIDLSPLVNELLSGCSTALKEKHSGIEDISSSLYSVADSTLCNFGEGVKQCPTETVFLAQKQKKEENSENKPKVIIKGEPKLSIGGVNDIDTCVEKVKTVCQLASNGEPRLEATQNVKDQEEMQPEKIVLQEGNQTMQKANNVISALVITEKAAPTPKLGEVFEKPEISETSIVNATEQVKTPDEKSPNCNDIESAAVTKGDESGEATVPHDDMMDKGGTAVTVSANADEVDKVGSLYAQKTEKPVLSAGETINYLKKTDTEVVATTEHVEKTKALKDKKDEQVEGNAKEDIWKGKNLGESFIPAAGNHKKFLDEDVLKNQTETMHSDVVSDLPEEETPDNCAITDEKDKNTLTEEQKEHVKPLEDKTDEQINEKQLSFLDTAPPDCSRSSLLCVTEDTSSEDKAENPVKDETSGRQEIGEDQLSGSDSGSAESAVIRTSGRKRKAPPPRGLSLATHTPGWIRGALLLLQRVSRFRGNARLKGEPSAASWFIKPVEAADAPGYHKIIKNPMDFGTIKSKLEAAEYTDHTQFHADMLLVKTNCYKYNPPGHDVRRDCGEVFQFYEAEYEKFAEKLEKCHLMSAKKPRSLLCGNESK